MGENWGWRRRCISRLVFGYGIYSSLVSSFHCDCKPGEVVIVWLFNMTHKPCPPFPKTPKTPPSPRERQCNKPCPGPSRDPCPSSTIVFFPSDSDSDSDSDSQDYNQQPPTPTPTPTLAVLAAPAAPHHQPSQQATPSTPPRHSPTQHQPTTATCSSTPTKQTGYRKSILKLGHTDP